LLRGARILVDAGAGLIAVPCNTAHAFLAPVEAQVGVRVVHMIDQTVRVVVDTVPRPHRVGLLATTGTVRAGLYQDWFGRAGVEIVLPTAEEQRAGRGLPELGITFDNDLWYVVIGLTVYNGVVIGEILRSGMEGLPGGQAEAAAALGLTPLQTTRTILLPQAARIMLPALISQLVVVLKDTSLGFIVSYEETLEVAKQIMGSLGNPIPVYFVLGAGFIAVNSALSWLARYTQRRLAR
jgi:ABC-type proline/glycine betaine transport system permease subunit